MQVHVTMENARVCICLLRKGNSMPTGWPRSINRSSSQLVSLLFNMPKHLQLLNASALQSIYIHLVDPNRIPATAIWQTLCITPASLSKCVGIDVDLLSQTRQCCNTEREVRSGQNFIVLQGLRGQAVLGSSTLSACCSSMHIFHMTPTGSPH